jgi:hypothetical protein
MDGPAYYYLGIDPGRNGGAALLDAGGGIVEVWRWREGRDPISSYHILGKYIGYKIPIYSYIEHIRLFPTLPPPILLNTQALLINVGQWHATLAILGIPYVAIPPTDWQARYGLQHWRKRQAKRDALAQRAQVPALTTPLALARHIWPDAPLRTQADDGVAVALLLADLARRDHQLATAAQHHDDQQQPLPLTITSPPKRRGRRRRP